MPVNTTAAVDSTFIYIMVFCFLLFAIIMFLTLYFVVRYRRSRNPSPSDISGNCDRGDHLDCRVGGPGPRHVLLRPHLLSSSSARLRPIRWT